jgi:hypothetical protein
MTTDAVGPGARELGERWRSVLERLGLQAHIRPANELIIEALLERIERYDSDMTTLILRMDALVDRVVKLEVPGSEEKDDGD